MVYQGSLQQTANKKHYSLHKKELFAQTNEWRETHRTQYNKYQREYRIKNHEQLLEKRRTYYLKIKEKSAQYRLKNHDKLKRQHKIRSLEVKHEVFSHYSEGNIKCILCGYTKIMALSIDHINGGGNKHRKEIGSGGLHLYYWLKQHNYPSGYRVLCMNCQFLEREAKNQYGNLRRTKLCQQK